MLNDFERFFDEKPEPLRGTLLYLRELINGMDQRMNESWKYRMPVFCIGKKMFCYLWVDQKTQEPYMGVVEGKRIEHPDLEQGKRSRMKIMRFKKDGDLPVESIREVLTLALALYPEK